MLRARRRVGSTVQAIACRGDAVAIPADVRAPIKSSDGRPHDRTFEADDVLVNNAGVTVRHDVDEPGDDPSPSSTHHRDEPARGLASHRRAVPI